MTQERLPDPERAEAQDLADQQRHAAEHQGLRREDAPPLRHGAERCADHPGGVLGGDHQNAQRPTASLREVDTGEAGHGGRSRRANRCRPAPRLARSAGRWPHPTPPSSRAAAIAVDNTSSGPSATSSTPTASRCRTRARGRAPGSRVITVMTPSPSTRNSTLSRVSSRKASSREASCGDSSCSVTPCCAARSPMASQSSPLTSKPPSAPFVTPAPALRSNRSRRSRLGRADEHVALGAARHDLGDRTRRRSAGRGRRRSGGRRSAPSRSSGGWTRTRSAPPRPGRAAPCGSSGCPRGPGRSPVRRTG